MGKKLNCGKGLGKWPVVNNAVLRGLMMAQPRVYRYGTSVQAWFHPSASSGGCPSMAAPAASGPAAAGSVSTISYLKLSIPISRSG